MIAKKNPDGSKYYYHNDHLGSASVLSSSTGSLVESTTYDPWGNIKTGGTKSKFLYTGQEHDSESKLHYYNARYYDPHIRRFTQPDTIIQDVYNPQSLNRYSYVNNNPLKYTDPTGHFSISNAWNSFKSAVSNAVNTVKSFVSSALKPKPPVNAPISNYVLPKGTVPQRVATNIPSQIYNNGNNQSHYTKESSVVYVDTGGSVGIGNSGFSLGGGVKFSNEGTTQYASLGGPSYGLTAYMLFSNNSIKQNSKGSSMIATIPGVSVQYNVDINNLSDISKYEFESIGPGCCFGVDFGLDYTGKTNPLPKDAPDFRSKELREINGLKYLYD